MNAMPYGSLGLAAWFFAAFGLSAAMVPLCRALAIKKEYVARPREDRWHRRPTALFGGIAIAVTAVVLGLIGGDWRALALPLAGGALIFIVGLTDDVLSLKPSTKLIAEIGLASLFVFFGQRLHWADVPVIDMLLTLVDRKSVV